MSRQVNYRWLVGRCRQEGGTLGWSPGTVVVRRCHGRVLMPDPLPGPRLRQVALVAHDCEKTATALQETFGWPDPFHDPGVGEFGLINAVFPVGDTFVEVVSPVQPDTTAGRYLARRGSDSGYMAIFQMPSLQEARRPVDASGVRVGATSPSSC